MYSGQGSAWGHHETKDEGEGGAAAGQKGEEGGCSRCSRATKTMMMPSWEAGGGGRGRGRWTGHRPIETLHCCFWVWKNGEDVGAWVGGVAAGILVSKKFAPHDCAKEARWGHQKSEGIFVSAEQITKGGLLVLCLCLSAFLLNCLVSCFTRVLCNKRARPAKLPALTRPSLLSPNRREPLRRANGLPCAVLSTCLPQTSRSFPPHKHTHRHTIAPGTTKATRALESSANY